MHCTYTVMSLMKQIFEVEENRSRRLLISVQKPARESGGAGGVTPPPLTITLFPRWSVDISFKDDVTVILRFDASYISYNARNLHESVERDFFLGILQNSKAITGLLWLWSLLAKNLSSRKVRVLRHNLEWNSLTTGMIYIWLPEEECCIL